MKSRDSNPLEQRVKPPALRPGDTVGIVAPASDFKRDQFDAGCRELRRLGYQPFYLPSIFERDQYFAGSAKRRAREVEEMFEREEVRAIVCARGGYGCNYLLQEIDMEIVRRHPKIFVGYSDVTTLLTWFSDAANLVTFHGPMVAKDFAHADGVNLASWNVLSGAGRRIEAADNANVQPLVEGTAEGILYGGCLSMLSASLGTPYEIQTDGTILLVEDVNTKPFQIDRMLMQLKLAGKLDKVRGIVFGEMLGCVQPGEQPYTLQEVVLRVVGDLEIPVAYGFPSGHVSGDNHTLPFGLQAALRVDKAKAQPVQLSFESPVASRSEASKSIKASVKR